MSTIITTTLGSIVGPHPRVAELAASLDFHGAPERRTGYFWAALLPHLLENTVINAVAVSRRKGAAGEPQYQPVSGIRLIQAALSHPSVPRTTAILIREIPEEDLTPERIQAALWDDWIIWGALYRLSNEDSAVRVVNAVDRAWALGLDGPLEQAHRTDLAAHLGYSKSRLLKRTAPKDDSHGA